MRTTPNINCPESLNASGASGLMIDSVCANKRARYVSHCFTHRLISRAQNRARASRTKRARHLKCAHVITYSLTRRYPSPRSGSCAAFCPSAPRSKSSPAALAWRGCTASRTSCASSAVTALNEFEGLPRVRAKWARASASPRRGPEGVSRAKVTRKGVLRALTSPRKSRDHF